MAVYVDPIREYPIQMLSIQARRFSRQWSHLTADTQEELHDFARRVGLRPEWYQDHPTRWHYDVAPLLRREAVKLGAVEVTTREMVRLMAERRRRSG